MPFAAAHCNGVPHKPCASTSAPFEISKRSWSCRPATANTCKHKKMQIMLPFHKTRYVRDWQTDTTYSQMALCKFVIPHINELPFVKLNIPFIAAICNGVIPLWFAALG